MTKLTRVSLALASCLLIGAGAGDVFAQDRSWDRERGSERRGGWAGEDRDGPQERGSRRRDRDDADDDRERAGRRGDRDDNRDRGWQGRDRDNDWERGSRRRDRDDDWDRRRDRWWRDDDRGPHCYVVRRRMVDRDGDVIVRRSRVCED